MKKILLSILSLFIFVTPAWSLTAAGRMQLVMGSLPACTSATIPSFTTLNGQPTSTTVNSNTVTPTFIPSNCVGSVAISISGASGEWKKNSGSYSSSAGTVSPGDTVTVELTTSGSNYTGATTTLTIGSGTQTFTANTILAAPTITPTAGDTQISVAFNDSSGASTRNGYWSASSGSCGSKTKVTGVAHPWVKTGLTDGTPYYFQGTDVDANSNESACSSEVTATPMGSCPSGCTIATVCQTNAETCTVRTRILAIDSGATINVANIDAAYTLMKNSPNGFSPLQWCATRFAYSSNGIGTTQVYDITSNAQDMPGYGTASYLPVPTASVQNGQPGFAFASAHAEYFLGGNIGITGANSGFIVAAGATGNTAGYLFQWGTYLSTNHIALYTNTYIISSVFNPSESTTNTVTSSVLGTSTIHHLWDWKISDTNWHIDNFTHDNTSIGSSSTNSYTPAGAIETIGADSASGPSYGGQWNGYINEWLILGSEYTSGQYTAITNYLNGIWALW